MVPSLILAVSGVAIAAVAFSRRAEPTWQRAMAWIMGLAIMQVVLGAVSAMLIR
jgi:hypothetical protein